MPKAIIKFDLSDPDDRIEFERVSKSLDLALSIWNFGYNTKKGFERELGEKNATEAEYEILERVYEKFWEIVKDHDINIDHLVQ